MKLRLVSRAASGHWVKVGGAFLFIIGLCAVVNAAPAHTSSRGEILTATNLNETFSGLDARIAKVEALPEAPLESVSDAPATGTIPTGGADGTPLVYPGVTLTLTPGTWLVEAYASVYPTGNRDTLQLGLYNATTNAQVSQSRSGVGVVELGMLIPLFTSKVLTVSTKTDIRMIAYPNGSSAPNVGGAGSIRLPEPQRMTAVKLR